MSKATKKVDAYWFGFLHNALLLGAWPEERETQLTNHAEFLGA